MVPAGSGGIQSGHEAVSASARLAPLAFPQHFAPFPLVRRWAIPQVATSTADLSMSTSAGEGRQWLAARMMRRATTSVGGYSGRRSLGCRTCDEAPRHGREAVSSVVALADSTFILTWAASVGCSSGSGSCVAGLFGAMDFLLRCSEGPVPCI